jgi:hypothetical protein
MWTAPPSAKVSLNDPLRYQHAAGLADWLWTPSNQTPIGKNDGSDHPLAAAFGCCA